MTLHFYSKKLDETTMELKKTSAALEIEKEKTDRLLHQMLPKKVADNLRDGKRVEAGRIYTNTNDMCIVSSLIIGIPPKMQSISILE